MTRVSVSKIFGGGRCDKGANNWQIYSKTSVKKRKTGIEGAIKKLGEGGVAWPPNSPGSDSPPRPLSVLRSFTTDQNNLCNTKIIFKLLSLLV